jgi:hypothetical protein
VAEESVTIVSKGYSRKKGHTAMIVVNSEAGSKTYHCVKQGDDYVANDGRKFKAE